MKLGCTWHLVMVPDLKTLVEKLKTEAKVLSGKRGRWTK